MKKGLSPIIATVLLITLVIAIAGIIFMWMRGFVTEQVTKFDKPTEQVCEQVDFDAQMISSYELEIANRGNVPISSFEIKRTLQSGDSETKEFSFSVNPGESARSEIASSNAEPAVKTTIYPVLLGTVKGKNINKQYTCLDKGKTI